MRIAIKVVITVAVLSLCFACASPPPAPEPSPQKDRAKSIVQGGLDAGQSAAEAPAKASAAKDESAKQVPSEPVSFEQAPPAAGQLSPEESAYLQSYLSRLNYMVYYNETNKLDPKLAKVGVSQANRYLLEKQGLSVIDFDQIEKNKKDQAAVYESETGGSIGIIQYLAQKFNADVYVEIDFSLSSEKKDTKYYASAQGAMKLFDASTATLLGSVVLSSQTAFSPNSADAAATNAIASSVWTAMPKMIDQSKELMKNSLARGIRYEVVLQKTPDSKQVSQLRRALAKKVREVEQVSYSASATKFNIYTFGKGDTVEDALYDAGALAGMKDLNLIYSRGKSYTFDSGL
jgi:hypothetical protein